MLKLRDYSIHLFWEKVDIRSDESCWFWMASKFKGLGYGKFNLNGKTFYAHRASYLFEYGNLGNDDQEICHTCDNRSCVNPSHLFLGTRSDNMIDASNKKRLHQQKKTHCPNGHKYSNKNTIINSKGSRECKRCLVKRRSSLMYKINMKIYRKSRRSKMDIKLKFRGIQGDLCIFEVDRIPDEKDLFIDDQCKDKTLAYGELSGHAHQFDLDQDVNVYKSNNFKSFMFIVPNKDSELRHGKARGFHGDEADTDHHNSIIFKEGKKYVTSIVEETDWITGLIRRVVD